jgi:hypothetical protein
MLFREAETQWMNQMQRRPDRCTGTGDVSGILRNFWFKQDIMQSHGPPPKANLPLAGNQYKVV